MNNESKLSVEETNKKLHEQLNAINKKINAHETIMQESPRKTEKQYIELSKLNNIRDQILVEINKINNNNIISNQMAKVDVKYNKNQDNIEKISNKRNSRFKFVNEHRKKKLNRLKKKKARIEKKQRRLVNSYLKHTYKEFEKYAKIEGKFTGKNNYYDANIEKNTAKYDEFNSKIIDNKGLHKVTNKYYQLRALPYEIKKERFKKLKNKNIISYGAKHSNKLDLIQMRNKIIEMHKEAEVINNEPVIEEKNNNIIDYFSAREHIEEERKNRVM